jgi:NAD(P)-dependent dehydrogenase (short-subunit alcohol dehydrogenase family)
MTKQIAIITGASRGLGRNMAVHLARPFVAQGIALGRVGQPDDIGGAVAAILSDEMGWANGTTFDISGGQLL